MILGINILYAGIILVLGIGIGYIVRRSIAATRVSSLEHKAEAQFSEAETKAKETVLKAQDKAASLIADAQKEARESKSELRQLEERLLKKEDSLEKQRE